MFDVKLIDWKIVGQWLALLFEMVFSAVVTFLFCTGTLLLTSGSATFAIAVGMVSAAAVLILLFLKSPLTKGLLVIVPTDAVQKAEDLQSTFETIERK